MTDWDPPQDLAALLDALAEEILAAPDDAVFAGLHEAAGEWGGRAQSLRRLVMAADMGSVVPPLSDATGLRGQLPRTQ